MRSRTWPGGALAKRDLALKFTLGGLVVSAVFINSGFWAAVFGARGMADMLATATVTAAVFTGVMIVSATFFHIQRLAAGRR